MENTENKKPNPDETVHVIDGIVELNHPAPFWWQSIFYISVIWAVGYMGYYLLGGAPTLRQELSVKLEKLNQSLASKNPSAEEDNNLLRAVYADSGKMANAGTVYLKNCASCHANDGGGGIGPNLTDSNWIHGDGSIDAIYEVVKVGVADKGMPPWGPILKRDELIAVSAYVRSLRGKSSSKPKAAQGNVIEYQKDI